jgi:Flp pilus assembly pilin Flp
MNNLIRYFKDIEGVTVIEFGVIILMIVIIALT